MPSPFRLTNGNIQIWAEMLRKMGVLLYKGPVNMETFVAYPSYPASRATFSYIFLQNLANSLHEKQKVSAASRMTRLNRASPFFNGRVPVTIGIRASPFSNGRVTLQAEQTFLHINTLVQLGQGETIRAGASAVVRSWLWQKDPYKRSLKMTQLEGTLFLNFSPYNDEA